MKVISQTTLRINLAVILMALISLGVTTNSNIKKESEYTEVLHFQNGYLPDGTPSHDNEMGEQPKWVEDELPYELNPDLASELFHLGYTRSEVRKRDFAGLDSLFSCEDVDTKVVTDCLPIYRDILIFRKGKTVIKIVQLCFECSQAHFVGPWKGVSAFGQRGEYKKLKALLER
jgi:hypothetical protein